MEKIKKHKSRIMAVIIILLLVIILGIGLKNLNMKWELILERAVPDVWLSNNLSFNNDIAKGGVTGFVKFDDKAKQPKGLRQYVQIRALNSFNENGSQLFSLTDIIKMDVLAPNYFDPVILKTINSSRNILTLVDDENNQYLINKVTGEVDMFDATKDTTRLITDQSDFREYVVELLK